MKLAQAASAYGRQGGTGGLVLERGLIHAEGVVLLGLGGDGRGGGVVVGVSAIAACAALKVVSVVKTLLGGLGADGEGRDLGGDVGSGGGAGHDGLACAAAEELVEEIESRS